GGDVDVVEPHLAVAYSRVGVLQLHPALSQRLDLRSLELDAGFPPLQQVVAVRGLAVGGDVARGRLALLAFLGHALRLVDSRPSTVDRLRAQAARRLAACIRRLASTCL